MDRERDDEELIDETLRASLAVEPSPDFLARVRSRVDEERRRPAGRAWSVWLAAAAAVIVVGLVLIQRWPRPQVAALPPSVLAPPAVASATERTPTPVPNVLRKPGRKPASRRDPEVVIDPREALALARFAGQWRPPSASLNNETATVLTAFDVPRYDPFAEDQTDSLERNES